MARSGSDVNDGIAEAIGEAIADIRTELIDRGWFDRGGEAQPGRNADRQDLERGSPDPTQAHEVTAGVPSYRDAAARLLYGEDVSDPSRSEVKAGDHKKPRLPDAPSRMHSSLDSQER